MPIGQGRQHWREAATQLAIERAQMRCETLQLAVLRFPLRQLRRQPGIQRRFPVVGLEGGQLRLCRNRLRLGQLTVRGALLEVPALPGSMRR